MDNYNPNRRYEWFRPREASRGSVALASSVNFATCLLTNASTGPKYLIVRNFRISSGAANTVRVGNSKAFAASATGVAVPMVPDTAPLDGVMGSLDAATQLVADYRVIIPAGNDQFWPNDWPVAILPPGWSLVFQVNVAAQALTLSCVWEAIDADQLDFTH